MENKEYLKELCKQLSEENTFLKDVVSKQQEQIEMMEKACGSNWINAKMFTDAINQAKETNKNLKKELSEVRTIKKEYKNKLMEILNQY